ncbi:hypothetical protein [Microbacterium sp. P04]|uniref:hypothetical protein n=1 Tax=Microbacterium sp. P04 TaxID=3366947 RepID=UPI00374603F1
MNWGDLHAFVGLCTRAGVEVPAPILRGIEMVDIANAHTAQPTGRLLTMTYDQDREHVTALSIRQHTVYSDGSQIGLLPGALAFASEIASEVREAVLPDLDRIVESLQPRFEEITAPLTVAAQQYGFTNTTRSDDVIELADEQASTIWRESRRAIQALMPIVAFRIAVSRTFNVSPTTGESHHLSYNLPTGEIPVNYSIAFAAGDNWSTDAGYYIEGKTQGHIDWLALAEGGLRLNTPTEVRMKLAAARG